MTNNKDFSYSKYPSREMKEFHSDFAEKENTRFWKKAAQIVWAIALLSIAVLLEMFFVYGAWLNYTLGNYFWVAYDIMIVVVQVPALTFLSFLGVEMYRRHNNHSQ